MKHLKLLLTMVMALTAIAAITATTANAEEGLLPTGSTFTASGPAGKLVSLAGSEIKCGGFKATGGSVTSNESGKIEHIDFEKCTALGFPVNSLGDASETILVDNASLLLCLITPATLVFGVLLKLKEAIHFEVPLVGALLKVLGSIIGTFTPNASGTAKTLVFAQKGGDPTVKECTNLLTGTVEKDELGFEKDGEKEESSGIEQEAKVTFNKAVEMMDK